MARRPRLDLTGFHHIVNRGVARGKVYKHDEDKEKFLEILCKACRKRKHSKNISKTQQSYKKETLL